MVKISSDMYREDVDRLRSWLERAFPYDWAESSASSGEDSLSGADIVLTAVLTVATEVAKDAVVDIIREKVRELRERYKNRHKDEDLAEVKIEELAEAGSPRIPPDGTDRDAS